MNGAPHDDGLQIRATRQVPRWLDTKRTSRLVTDRLPGDGMTDDAATRRDGAGIGKRRRGSAVSVGAGLTAAVLLAGMLCAAKPAHAGWEVELWLADASSQRVTLRSMSDDLVVFFDADRVLQQMDLSQVLRIRWVNALNGERAMPRLAGDRIRLWCHDGRRIVGVWQPTKRDRQPGQVQGEISPADVSDGDAGSSDDDAGSSDDDAGSSDDDAGRAATPWRVMHDQAGLVQVAREDVAMVQWVLSNDAAGSVSIGPRSDAGGLVGDAGGDELADTGGVGGSAGAVDQDTVVLRNGDVMRGLIVAVQADHVELWLAGAGSQVDLPIDSVRSIRYAPAEDVTGMQPGEDAGVPGEDAGVAGDELMPGTLERDTTGDGTPGGGAALSGSGQEARGSLPGATLPGATLPGATLPGAVHRVVLRDGSIWDASSILIRSDQVQVVWHDSTAAQTTSSQHTGHDPGRAVSFDVRQLRRVDLASPRGRLVNMMALPWQVIAGGEVFGEPTLPYLDHGIWRMHAPVRVLVPLPARADGLVIRASLADDFGDWRGGRSSWAHCQLKVIHGDQVIASNTLSADQPVAVIRKLLASDAAALELVLDAGVNGPVMDRVAIDQAWLIVGR